MPHSSVLNDTFPALYLGQALSGITVGIISILLALQFPAQSLRLCVNYIQDHFYLLNLSQLSELQHVPLCYLSCDSWG